ncbi:16S rRNA (cytosine(1402)-N(4))-methyltransferase RsmH [Patescibacteria group bacterium]|nr:16S rRNA (cytosine(1402)-N(4))-methyltransferase RsmH [Patescibacteria group bacterium]MBU1473201.1 16S rRNA (cytosine(1402)-N(4))-methyltransferase RsmH [Patescibacteria group bacterium]MBU2459749.1 16S rRNA (cytosine(1402)-N(4))-methyltransferase RsmH [Patescibacteria group bacterium]MBU2544742.1 16S rRNA (cytosine(1402)-N(4))-methyltransferase RsmH [Patescibacteria group bacterium]
MNDYHVPVMLKEVIDGLNIKPGKKYIDATIGGGGHGWEIVKLGGYLLGIDTDRDALEFARRKLEDRNSKLDRAESWKLVQGNFRNIEKIAKENGFDKTDGILFDLGVSSHQLDTPSRGFSYRYADAPLDLRFDQRSGETAKELLAGISEADLYEILIRFGEEKLARRIARAFILARTAGPVETVGRVASIVADISGTKRVEATLSRVFQAVRIAVNSELEALKDGLSGAYSLLRPGGRLVVVSFHSLEDRKVKRFMRSGGWKTVTKKPIVATQAERRENSRSRSAKLRIAEKL